ncbi:3-isopropylmalate/3-methylmalate dehydrogenase [Candidatus Gugararchaeum adminiculabundum]|nr:3-isopropylmalate/3-methylmalate dehydrogenase [Candidatus Gugararchaeum adminiculabundum]
MAKTYHIGLVGGDGVGPEVLREGKKVVDAATRGFKIDWVDYPYGGEHYMKTGELLPDAAIEEMRKLDAIYLGAVGHPKVKTGIIEKGLLLKMRFALDLYVNLRPVKLYENVPTVLAGKGPKDINFYVVRENTEDFYIGSGGTVHEGTEDEVAFQIGTVSYKGSKRIMEYAFELCKEKGMNRVTAVDKANVLTYVYGLWRRVFEEVGAKYPNIEKENNFVDAITQWFVRKPEWYQVVVTPNMFGDIITDLAAAIQGGMGMAAGGNINPGKVSMFEPIHGSAPKYTNQNVINPIAAILAGGMMLEHIGEKKAGANIERAVEEVMKDGKVRTKDLNGTSKTSEVGDEVARKVAKLVG